MKSPEEYVKLAENFVEASTNTTYPEKENNYLLRAQVYATLALVAVKELEYMYGNGKFGHHQ